MWCNAYIQNADDQGAAGGADMTFVVFQLTISTQTWH